jgi:hypothetical protein
VRGLAHKSGKLQPTSMGGHDGSNKHGQTAARTRLMTHLERYIALFTSEYRNHIREEHVKYRRLIIDTCPWHDTLSRFALHLVDLYPVPYAT